MILKGYPDNSDITLLDTMYNYPKKLENGKWDDGSLTVVFRDNVTGKKQHEEIKNPMYDFYIAKDGYKTNYNRLFAPIEELEKVTTPYKDILKTIAQKTGNMEFFIDNLKNRNSSANKALHTHKDIFLSDYDIQDNFRFVFNNHYKNDLFPLSKSYLDIEADTINMVGDFPEPGECPINAVTVIMEKENKCFTFILRNKNNPLIQEFEDSVGSELFKELKEFVRDAVGGWKDEQRFGLHNMEYNFLFYDEEKEINMIKDIFNAINLYQPDFVLAWNMAFDIPYIIERIKKLGYRPEDIMCHPDFKNKVARYFIDERVKSIFAERGDFASISSYSVFIDQMIQFASRRKAQASQFTHFGLDYIGGMIAKVRKYDYKHITTSIAKFPYLNFKLFIFYNIMDVIVQKCIEKKTNDIDYLFNKCNLNNTRYCKCHRQTVYLTNRGVKEFYNNGFIMGNNINKQNVKKEKFPGAYVADPSKLNEYSKIKINNLPIYVFNNLVDFDYSSLYPSLLRECNMAPNTQKGKIIIHDKIYENEDRFKMEHYDRAGEFVEDLSSGVIIEFAERWLHFAGYEKLYDDTIEFFTKKKSLAEPLLWFNHKAQIKPIVVFNNKNIIPIEVYSEDEKQTAIVSSKAIDEKLMEDIHAKQINTTNCRSM